MDEDINYESSNINSIWLQNIYENIKNLEAMERLAREGCSSILEYLQIPYEARPIIIADTQYKNLKLIYNELYLLLSDLVPVIKPDEMEKFRDKLDALEEVIKIKKLFVKERYSKNKSNVISSEVTNFFYQTLKFLSNIKIAIIINISHILYVKEEDKKTW